MRIVGEVINSIEKECNDILQSFRNIRNRISLQIFVSPIERENIDQISSMLRSNNFTKQRKKYSNPDSVDIILNSYGGDADAAYHLAKILDSYFSGEITYIVPRYAKSAATLLACGGNKIIMGETSELGPLDPQIPQEDGSYISAKAVKTTVELIKKQLEDKDNGLELATILANRINPLVLGQYESTIKIAEEYQKELLSIRMLKGKSKKEINIIVNKFAQGYTHHSRVIGCKEAADILGNSNVEILDVRSKEWQLLWSLYTNQKYIADLQGLLRAKKTNI